MAGAGPPPPVCLEKMNLLSLWAVTARHYFQAAVESERRGDTTLEPTNKARNECESAYKAFENHRNKHGC